MSVCFPMGALQVRFAAETHVGQKRAHNEDSFHLPGPERLAVVADGMGGHNSGEVASTLAVATLTAYVRDSEDEPELTWPYRMDKGLRHQATRMSTGVKLANARIWETAQQNPAQHGMGTTLVAALFVQDHVITGHVGDSRVYRLRDGKFTQLTDDHSLWNDYTRMKTSRGEAVDALPQKNVIVRALGMKESVKVDVAVEAAAAGDQYLLCSDGLTGMVPDAVIAKILETEADIDAAAARLVEAANEGGGTDNITALVARVEKA